MSTTNIGYEASIREALKKRAPKYSPFASTAATGFPTVGFLAPSDSGGLFSKIAPYLIYLLLILFVILLILVIVHYTVKPIFNFGDNPDALINFSTPNWKKSWDDSEKIYIDEPSSITIPKFNYSFIVDVSVSKIEASSTTGNIYVFLYKTAGVQLPQANSNEMLSKEVVLESGTKYAANILSNFDFLSVPKVPDQPIKPSLVLAYDAIAGKIVLYFNTSIGSTPYLNMVSAPISPKQTYRVGVVATDKIVELYLNQLFVGSKVYSGTLQGTDNDLILSVPSKFSTHVAAANLFTLDRVVSSGEIRAMGGPAQMKLA